MRRILVLGLLFATACSLSPTNLPSGQTASISCTDSKESCEDKAVQACPRGYAVVKENPPVGTGIYYTEHDSPATAKEEMVYSMTVQCK
jgi:hypothetical protein